MTQGEQLYIEGKLEEARPVLAAEAKEGNGRALYCLGQYELFGLLGAERPAEAAALFHRGAADPLARLMEALFLRPGAADGDAVKDALAAAEAEGAAGNANALFARSAVLWAGLDSLVEKDGETARACCETAADLGFWQAEMEMGLHFLNGQYVEKNGEKGAALMKRAAEKGVGKAEYHLAYCLLAGVGVEKNPSLAVSYYQKALRHGYVRAAVELGVYYETGLYVRQDKKKACQLFKKAAEKGDADGKAHLADGLLDGSAGKRSPRKAAELYAEAARGGSAYAVLRLGELAFSRGDEGTAFRYFHDAARLGLPAAQYLAGLCLLRGRGVAPDRKAAAVWLRQAAQSGSREAAQLLMQAGL